MFGNAGDRELLEKTALAYVSFLAKARQYPAALRQLDALEALQQEELTPQVDNLRGVIYLRAGDLDSAEACLRKSIGVRSGNAAAYFYLGIISERRNDPAEAADMYRQALAYNQTFGPAKARLERLMNNRNGNIE
jgi:tetratricopeptide (TPR) repeat protein